MFQRIIIFLGILAFILAADPSSQPSSKPSSQPSRQYDNKVIPVHQYPSACTEVVFSKYTRTQNLSREKTKIVVFIPTPIPSSVSSRDETVGGLHWSGEDRVLSVLLQFRRENWRRSEVVLLFVYGSKTGAQLEKDLDYRSIHVGRENFTQGVDYFVTSCRDYGDEFNNPNGTSATTCKVYEALKYIVSNFKADIVWRGADDSYLNIRLFVKKALSTLPKNKPWWFGHYRYVDPRADDKIDSDLLLSRQPNLLKKIGMRKFVSYMYGMGYAMSWSVALHIAAFVIPPHLTHCEDVMVGLWLLPFQVERVHSTLVGDRDWFPKQKSIQRILVHHMEASDWRAIAWNGSIVLK